MLWTRRARLRSLRSRIGRRRCNYHCGFHKSQFHCLICRFTVDCCITQSRQRVFCQRQEGTCCKSPRLNSSGPCRHPQPSTCCIDTIQGDLQRCTPSYYLRLPPFTRSLHAWAVLSASSAVLALSLVQLEAGPVDEEEYQLYRSTTDLREPYRQVYSPSDLEEGTCLSCLSSHTYTRSAGLRRSTWRAQRNLLRLILRRHH